MKFFNLTYTIDEVIYIIPGVIQVMAFPLSLILEYVIPDSAGKDAGYSIFRLSINLDWWWWRFNLTRQWVYCCFVESVSTENVAHLHVLWEI